MPGDVLREAFVELPEERIASRGASAVHDLCRRLEQNAPPGLAQTSGEIALFCVKEEALVESSDVLECGSADEHGRAFHGLDLARSRVVLPRCRVAAKRTSATREKRQAGALAEDPPQRREPQNRRLKSPIRVRQTWPDRCRAGIRVEGGDESLDAAGLLPIAQQQYAM